MIDLLITGVHGQLGRALEKLARQRGLTVAGHDLDTLDICDRTRGGGAGRHGSGRGP